MTVCIVNVTIGKTFLSGSFQGQKVKVTILQFAPNSEKMYIFQHKTEIFVIDYSGICLKVPES